MRRFSPYAYAFDNTIRFIDADGMAPEDIILKGDKKTQDAYLTTLHHSTGNTYALKDDKLTLLGGDASFKGEKSTTLANIIEKGINSNETYAISLVGSKGDDKGVFIDSYQQGKVDVADLKKLGNASTSLQGAAIGHFLNEIQQVPGYSMDNATTRDANFNSAHSPSLGVEGRIYGELTGDASVTTRTTIPSTPSGGYQNVTFKYNNSNIFELIQGASSKSVQGFTNIGGVKIPTTTTTVLPTGELKSVKKLP